jgi:hypothetical protein
MRRSAVVLSGITLETACAAVLLNPQRQGSTEVRLDTLKLPEGVSIAVFASDVPAARLSTGNEPLSRVPSRRTRRDR